jgi:deoxyribodipyrimidine photo-lyase
MTVARGSKALAIVWFRVDLRIRDNAALAAAASSGAAIIPLFIDDDELGSRRKLGGASTWWRGRSLAALDAALRDIGSRLIIRQGKPEAVFDSLIGANGARSVYFNLCRDRMEDDAATEGWLRTRGITVERFDGNYLHDPVHIRTGTGGGFKVFTPFWNRLRGEYTPATNQPAPRELRAPKRLPESLPIDALQVTDRWTRSLARAWTPGEAAARKRLTKVANNLAAHYQSERDRPDRDGTSRLSPHLAWGEISVDEIWRRLDRKLGEKALPLLRQLGWRDFNMHLMQEFPDLSWRPMQAKFAAFPAKDDDSSFRTWTQGKTGYPIVDAGMRQLWQTGWMHNRVRMITASFLVKDLLIPWQRGEQWFWDTLVDADPAQNAGNWQWIAGCGADAAPFFRIFNPVLQGEKFDPDGRYVRQWLPELARLPAPAIHRPWTASAAELSKAGVIFGKTYPHPLVDHGQTRRRALKAYEQMSRARRA